jgi:tetratricopeptide (TPR) repeat protein
MSTWRRSYSRLGAMLFVLGVGACEGFFETPHSAVEEGNAALAIDDLEGALTSYELAAAELPESAELDYARGVALSLANRHDEATQRLLRALQTKDSDLRLRVHAGLGASYSRWALELERAAASVAVVAKPDMAIDAPPPDEHDPAKVALPKWERAVDHLEKALRVKLDPDVLRNLEIALLRVDPPCSSRNDEHEPNDRAEQATLVELAAAEAPEQSSPDGQATAPGAQDRLSWTRQLYACPDDVDWFQIPLQAGDRLTVKLNADAAEGMVAVALHAPGGQPQLVPGLDAVEPVTSLSFTAPVGGDGLYLLRVWNVDGEERTYGLDVEMRPACERVEDDLEENDGPGEATMLTPGLIEGLKICPEDEDWFQVALAEGESVFVFASVAEEEDAEADSEGAEGAEKQQGPPPIDVEIMGPEGNTLSAGSPAGAGEVATLLMPGPGIYMVRVRGLEGLEARYQLLVKVVPPCPEGDDPLEDNDLVEDATDVAAAAQQLAAQGPQGGAAPSGLPPGVQRPPGVQLPPGLQLPPGAQGGGQPPSGPPPPMLLRICPDDVDWLIVTAQPESNAVVSAIFEHEKGDLSMTLFEAGTQRLLETSDASTPTNNGEGFALPPVEEPTAFTIRVQGKPGQENFYLLRIDNPQPQSSDEQEPSDEEQEEQEEQEQEEQEQEEQQKEQPQEKEQKPLEDALDQLDHNPENLEAKQRAQRSPLVNHPPEKDW